MGAGRRLERPGKAGRERGWNPGGIRIAAFFRSVDGVGPAAGERLGSAFRFQPGVGGCARSRRHLKRASARLPGLARSACRGAGRRCRCWRIGGDGDGRRVPLWAGRPGAGLDGLGSAFRFQPGVGGCAGTRRPLKRASACLPGLARSACRGAGRRCRCWRIGGDGGGRCAPLWAGRPGAGLDGLGSAFRFQPGVGGCAGTRRPLKRASACLPGRARSACREAGRRCRCWRIGGDGGGRCAPLWTGRPGAGLDGLGSAFRFHSGVGGCAGTRRHLKRASAGLPGRARSACRGAGRRCPCRRIGGDGGGRRARSGGWLWGEARVTGGPRGG